MPESTQRAREAWRALRRLALSYPEASEDWPWGHTAFKVRGRKVFLFLNGEVEPGLSLTVKLPDAADVALILPFTEPTGYGLGRHGWVTARFADGDTVPLALLGEWVEESDRAVAPKTLARRLDDAG